MFGSIKVVNKQRIENIDRHKQLKAISFNWITIALYTEVKFGYKFAFVAIHVVKIKLHNQTVVQQELGQNSLLPPLKGWPLMCHRKLTFYTNTGAIKVILLYHFLCCAT